MSTYVAIDVGGTQLRVATYPGEGTTPIRQKRIPTRGKCTVLDHTSLVPEFGHITVLPDGLIQDHCVRRQREAIGFCTDIVRHVPEEIFPGIPSSVSGNAHSSIKKISEATIQENAPSLTALARAGAYIGRAAAECFHIPKLSFVILKGGMVQSGNLLLDPLRKAIKEIILSPAYFLKNPIISPAAFGDDDVLFGALAPARSL